MGFELPELEARPGDTLEIPVTVSTEAPLSMMAFSVEFDPQVLQLVGFDLAEEVREVLDRVPEAESELASFASATEGWLQVSLVLDFQARAAAAVSTGRHAVIVLRFAVSAGAPEGSYPLVFTRPESAPYPSHFGNGRGPVYNSARGHGRPFTEEDKFEDPLDPELDDGVVVVLPLIGDVGIFLRGDANADRRIDISDPVAILGYLFLGLGESLPCEDAADSNDDGRLDVSDPVTILDFLFGGTAAEPLLSSVPAEDLTLDPLGCTAY